VFLREMIKVLRFSIGGLFNHSGSCKNRWVDRLLELETQSVCVFCQERLHGSSLLGRPGLQEIEIFFRHGYGQQCHTGTLRFFSEKATVPNDQASIHFP
jgi:hypothetical protein